MKEIHEMEIPWIISEVKEKKKQRVLYVTADEDHVSLQFNKVKGDLTRPIFDIGLIFLLIMLE